MIFSNFGFIAVFCITNVIYVHKAEDIDLISDLYNKTEENKIIQYSKLWNDGKTVWTLNCSDNNRRQMKLSKDVTKAILLRLKDDRDFGICVILKRDQRNFGTLFSITDKDRIRLLEIKTGPKENLIRLIYIPDKRHHAYKVEKFEIPLSSKSGHFSLCFEYQSLGTQVTIRSDCYHKILRSLRFPFPRSQFFNRNPEDFQIWIGQRNSQKGFYKGILENFRFSHQSNFSKIYCSKLLENAVVSSTKNSMSLKFIESKLTYIEKEMKELMKKLTNTEIKLTDLSQCQCFPLCLSSKGERKSFSQTWKENKCRTCNCTHEGKTCFDEKCPILQCKHKVSELHQCCDRCGHNCQYQGVGYQHGENVDIKCLRCSCKDGSLSCRRINPKVECPRLKCSRFYQVKVQGKCCKVCKKRDLCNFNSCGPNALCVTSSTLFTCLCKIGFQGNPYIGCQDIDECKAEKYCPKSTECKNTEGSFQCVCKTGYEKINSSSQECIPLCTENPCKNNSTCVSPNKCECSVGYSGPQCDLDIDECEIGIAKCPTNSECINIPGSYVCQCLNGYRPTRPGTISVSYDHQCKDIDECSGTRGVDHVCDKTSTCINFPGGYECILNDVNYFGNNCQIHKNNNEIEVIANGKEFVQSKFCQTCQCFNGNLYCRGLKCDCSVPISKDCCRKCYPNQCDSAKMVDMVEKDFTCMTHKSSCPNKECPNIKCRDSVTISGQCCDFCRSDVKTSCLLQYSNFHNSSTQLGDHVISHCSHNNKEFAHGVQLVLHHLKDGSCIKCLCWNQHFCCAKSFKCGT